jgi:hypothetical protein
MTMNQINKYAEISKQITKPKKKEIFEKVEIAFVYMVYLLFLFDWLIDHVDGVRLCLWTAASNRPMFIPR